MVVADVLAKRGRQIDSIESSASVEAAIHQMTQKGASALMVTEGERIVGIFAERDVLRSYVQTGGKPFQEIMVKEAMTRKLISARPEDELLSTINTMFQADIRHLPVFDGGKLVGMLSLRDVVQYELESLEEELEFLKAYVADLKEAGKD